MNTRTRRRLIPVIMLMLLVLISTLIMSACSPEPSKGTEGVNAQESQKTEEVKNAEEAETVQELTGDMLTAENETISIMALSNYPEVNPADVVFWKELQEKTNVTVELEIVTNSAWDEKKGLVLAQNELPDVFMSNSMFTDYELLDMAEAGQIIPIDGLIEEYGVHSKSLFELQPDIIPSITASDGHIYGFPAYIGKENTDATTLYVTYLNAKWLDALGLDVPTTTDELQQTLMDFKTKDPNGNGIADEIPLSVTGTNYFHPFFGAFGIVPNNNQQSILNIGMKEGQVIYSPLQPEYREAIKYLNTLWEDGLIDPESFTQDGSMFKAKVKNTTRTVGCFYGWRGTSWRLDAEDDEYIAVAPFIGPEGDQLYPELYRGVQSRSGYTITSSCENPELAFKLGDYLLEPDNMYQLWSTQGLGYHLEKTDDNMMKQIRDVDRNNPEDVLNSVVYRFQCIDTQNMARRIPPENPLDVLNEKRTTDKLYNQHYPQESFPNVFMTLEESRIINELTPAIEEYVEQMYAKWITAGGVEEDAESFEKRLNSMGLEELLAAYQQAADRYYTMAK